ncbi:MAG: DNA methyltransferase [Candidatus Acidiferrales bacterium]
MRSHLIEERLEWRRWVTPKALEEKPVHRWYVFPHSFSSELVHALIAEWGLTAKDRILDPFAGAGTTLLAAKQKHIPVTGYDLSPLAVFASRAKLRDYDPNRLCRFSKELLSRIEPARWNSHHRTYPVLVENALPGRLISAFDDIGLKISKLSCSDQERDFFRLALLTILPQYSRLVATGGWLKCTNKRPRAIRIPETLTDRLTTFSRDVVTNHTNNSTSWSVEIADARRLPDPDPKYSAVITSPPYPNRHDYTRVFGVELLFAFLDWSATRKLRYQSFESHPEAHPHRPDATDYTPPRGLARAVARIKKEGADPRVVRMLEGYFLDMFLCLREVKRVSKPGARIAFILGNAQYCGVPVPVDEYTADVGERLGLSCRKILVARYRGNSAQQMSRFGRIPSRESVIVFCNS